LSVRGLRVRVVIGSVEPRLETGLENVFLAAADGLGARRTTCYPDRIQHWLSPPIMTYA